MDKLLTKYEVMNYLNISRRHFEKLVSEGNLPIIKITENKRYMRSSHLKQYIDEHTINKPQETPQEVPKTEDLQWKPIFGSKK